MRHVVVGTAGHIDHGKSSLVLALTGTDPDRLKEEKARGITVDLGFAHLEHGGVTYAFVDVPGHERFVRNMLAGASGFDVVLLVVAADESVMPQTREHIEICRLLGVRSAVVALSRIDLVDDSEFVELAALEVRELLEGSAMAAAPVVPVSSKTGEGLDKLRGALAAAAGAAGVRDASGPFRLPVDRAFTMRGFGAVVTGTLASGQVAVGSDVAILPGGERARVRGMQVHGVPVDEARAGQRAALNLAGSGRLRVERGSVIAAPGELASTRMLDVRLEVLAWAAIPVEDEDRVHLHVGTATSLARVRLLGGAAALAPGDCGLAQLRLETPLTALRGDRCIIRRYSPVITIGGGTVLDSLPPKRSPKSPAALARVAALDGADDFRAAREFAIEAGLQGVTEAALRRRLGLRAPDAASLTRRLAGQGEIEIFGESAGGGDGRILLATRTVLSLADRMLELLSTWETEHRLRAGMAVEQLRAQAGVTATVADGVLARLEEAGAVQRTRHTVETAGRRIELTGAEQDAFDGLAALLRERGYTPPTLGEAAEELGVPGDLVDALRRLLLRDGRAVEVSPELYFDAGRMADLRGAVAERAAVNPEIDVAWFKQNFGLSRKYAIPLLEWLDRERVTVRVGNLRRIRAGAAPGVAP